MAKLPNLRSLSAIGRQKLALALGIALALSAGCLPAAAQKFTEFSTSGNPAGIAVGPDGALWFTEGLKIGRITTSGVIAEFPLLAGSKGSGHDIVAGPDGALWFLDPDPSAQINKVGRMTTGGVVTEFPIPAVSTEIAAQTSSIAVGSDGALWFTKTGKNITTLGRITTGGVITAVPFAVLFDPNNPVDALNSMITAGPDGALWFAARRQTGGEIVRLTPAGVSSGFHDFNNGPFVDTSSVTAITSGPDGALWFTGLLPGQSGMVNAIGRVTTSGTLSGFPVPSVPAPFAVFSGGITAGPDGALWIPDLGNQTSNPTIPTRLLRTTLAGVFAQYDLPTFSGPDSIVTGPDGALWFTETSNMKIVRLVPTPTNSHDFSGDGKSDILWRNTSGLVAAWLMNGGAVVQSAAVGTVPTSFSIIGQHDFDGDGKADVLWRDASGTVSIWFMNGVAPASSALVGNATSNWAVYGTGDLNGDGKGDLLWRDSTSGTVAVWFMNGAAVASTAVFGALPSSWTIVADANGSILWRDSAGDIALWSVQNGQVTSSHGLGTVTANFVLQGIGDFNGDGNADILWRDTNSGTLSIWFTNGAQVTSGLNVGTLSSNWSVAQIGDYDGDGKSDILLLDSAGDVAMWLMNGAAVSSSVGVGNVGTTWQVQNLNVQ